MSSTEQNQRSDFIVRWIGKHLHDPEQTEWTDLDSDRQEQYVSLLEETLRHGLWVCMPEAEDYGEILVGEYLAFAQKLVRLCFSEVRLSRVRPIASRYGRLGLGFRRCFITKNGGAPVFYHPVTHFVADCFQNLHEALTMYRDFYFPSVPHPKINTPQKALWELERLAYFFRMSTDPKPTGDDGTR